MSDRTIEIRFTSGPPKRVTIPDTWKVTFGSVVPGKAAVSYGLRLWESDDKQRAVFTDVVSFRDLTVEVQVSAVRKFGTEAWYLDDGTIWGLTEEQVERQWLSDTDVSRDRPDWAADDPTTSPYRRRGPMAPF